MDDCGNDLSASGVVLSPEELKEKRQRNGQCPACGLQCYRKKALRFGKKLLADAVLDRLEPLTVEGRVLNGRCLICNPQTQEELDQRAAEAAEKAAARATLDDSGGRSVTILAPTSSDDNDQPERQMSEPLIGPLAPKQSSKRTGLRAAFAKGRNSSLGNVDKSFTSSSVDKNDGERVYAKSVATLSHDDFFAQFDVPGKKVKRSPSNDDDPPRSRSASRGGERRPKPDRYNERRKPDGRSRGIATREMAQKSKRGGRENSSYRGKQFSFNESGGSNTSSRSDPDKAGRNKRNDKKIRRGSKYTGRRHSDDIPREKKDVGRKGLMRRESSDEIRKMMRKSQRRLKYVRRKSERKLSSRSSISSDSDDESSGSSSSSDSDSTDSYTSEEGSYSENDSDGASADGLSNSWREKGTPQEKMQSILDNLARVAINATTNLAETRVACSELKEKEASTKKTKWYASKQLKDAQERQAVALEKEDYEAADELGTVIEESLKALTKQKKVYEDIRERMAKMDRKKEEAVRSATLCLKEAQDQLSELHDDLVDSEKDDERVLSQFSVESTRLSSESERLAQELKTIEREEELLGSAKEELLGGEMKEFEEQLGDASAKLVHVNDTIQELRVQLAKAEATAAFLNKRIAIAKENIEDIEHRHSEELAQVDFKFRSTKERREIWASENKANDEAKSSHETAMDAFYREVKDREKVIITADEETLAAIDLDKIVVNAFDVEETKESEDNNDETAEVDEVVIYEALVDEKQALLFEAEANIDKLDKEIRSIDSVVPILEAKKRGAASERDFKSASKVSKKIKKALARKERCEEQLNGEATEREQYAKEELEKYTSLMEEKKKATDEKGRETGVKRMEQLKEANNMLKFILTKLATVPERDATRVSVVGGFLINTQLSVLDAEGRALGEKYDGWEDTTPEKEVVEKFISPIMSKGGSSAEFFARQRTRLSVLLDEKMGLLLGQSLAEFCETEHLEESFANNYKSASTLTLDTGAGSGIFDKSAGSGIFEA